ncbi:MAG TPA: hypothetical protein V6D22_18755 [Candidatus Obscuribacterales bacterium]
MKLSAAIQLSLAVTMAFGIAAQALPSKKQPAQSTPPAATAVISTPELDTADARVKQAEGQLDLAKKQLKAAQSILKAAEADLKAARAERQAIALRTQAQTVANEAGMRPEGNKALAEVDSAAVTASRTGMPVMPQTAMPMNAVPMTAPPRNQSMDFTAAPAAAPSPDSADSVTPAVELR